MSSFKQKMAKQAKKKEKNHTRKRQIKCQNQTQVLHKFWNYLTGHLIIINIMVLIEKVENM